jgi:hypothetical protein
MHKGVLGREGGVNCHCMTRVSAVGRRALDAVFAVRTDDQHRLARLEIMKPLQKVDATQGDSLLRGAAVASIGDLCSQPAEQVHPVFQAGWLGRSGLPATRNSSAIGS